MHVGGGKFVCVCVWGGGGQWVGGSLVVMVVPRGHLGMFGVGHKACDSQKLNKSRLA